MVRTVYSLLNSGVAWHSLSFSQQQRYKRDAYFRSTAGKGFRHVRVAEEDAQATRKYSQSRALHRQRVSSNGFHSRSLGLASSWAFKYGHVTEEEHKNDRIVAKWNDWYKHDAKAFASSSTDAAIHPQDRSWADVARYGSALHASHQSWADIQDDGLDDVKGSVNVSGTCAPVPSDGGCDGHDYGTGGALPKELEASFTSDNGGVRSLLPKSGDGNGGFITKEAVLPNPLEALDKKVDSSDLQHGTQSFYKYPGSDKQQGYWQLQVATLREENSALFRDIQRLAAQLVEAESALQVWTSHAGLLELQNRELQALSVCEPVPQLSPGRDPPASSAPLETDPFFQNSCWSENSSLLSFSGFQKSALVQNVSTKTPVQNFFPGVFGAGGAQAIGYRAGEVDGERNSQIDESVRDSSLRIQVLEKQMEKVTAMQGESLERQDSFDGRLRKLASSLGTVVQESVEKRFVSAAAKFVLVDGLDQQLKTSHEHLAAALSTLLTDQLNVTIEQVVELMRNEFGGNKSCDSRLASSLKEFADKDAMVQKQCEELQQAISQLAESLACSRDDADKSLAQLWVAFDILKSEVKELMRSQAEVLHDDEKMHENHESAIQGSAASDAALSSGQLLRPNRIANGSVVVTHSLRSSALNGVMGIVLAFHEDRQRYAVRIMGSDHSCPEEKLFKGENLLIDENMPVFDPKECQWIDYECSRSS